MKKILVLSLIFLFSCNRKGYQPQAKHVSNKNKGTNAYVQGVNNSTVSNSSKMDKDNKTLQPDKNNMVAIYPIIRDTIFDYACDTVVKRAAYPPYKVSEDTLAKISKLFVKDIVEPENQTHPRFVNYWKKVIENIDSVRDDLHQWAKMLRLGKLEGSKKDCMDTLLKMIGGEKEINSCSIKPMLHYYLTVNYVLHNGDENLKKYYDLDTIRFIYAILKDDSLVGISHRTVFSSNYQSFYNRLMLPIDHYNRTYNFIKQLHKEPFMFSIGLGVPQNYGGLGFVQNHHVMGCSIYDDEGGYCHIVVNNKSFIRNRLCKTFRILSSEASSFNIDAPNYRNLIRQLYKRSEKESRLPAN